MSRPEDALRKLKGKDDMSATIGSKIMIVSDIKRPNPESLHRMIKSLDAGKPPEVEIFHNVINQGR